ncbi:hypothetical protein ABG067_006341 [Albugo candida]
MTGMGRCNPAKAITLPSCSFPTMTLKRIQELQVLEFEDLRDSVVNMHKSMPSTCDQRRNAERARRNGRSGLKMAQFSIGDYVLYTEVWKTCSLERARDMRNLITGEEREAHASRLKLYADKN